MGKNVFKDLIAKYASLPLAQHDQLVQDLVLEPFFKKLESDKRFKHIFSLRQAMGENHKQLRLCQRPLLQVISELDRSLAKVKEFGIAAGFKFVTDPARRENSKVPKPLLDNLAIDFDASSVFPTPSLPSVLDGVRQISDVDAQIVRQNEDGVYYSWLRGPLFPFLSSLLELKHVVSRTFAVLYSSFQLCLWTDDSANSTPYLRL